jgi:hypothetical protein
VQPDGQRGICVLKKIHLHAPVLTVDIVERCVSPAVLGDQYVC